MRKTMIPLAAALTILGASAASALPGRDGDNNPVPSGRESVRHAAPAFGAGIFAGPRLRYRRTSDDWDRCIRRGRSSCVHN